MKIINKINLILILFISFYLAIYNSFSIIVKFILFILILVSQLSASLLYNRDLIEEVCEIYENVMVNKE
jgi:hypothetical protein